MRLSRIFDSVISFNSLAMASRLFEKACTKLVMCEFDVDGAIYDF